MNTEQPKQPNSFHSTQVSGNAATAWDDAAGVQPSQAQSLAKRVDDLRDKAGMPLDQARELALSEAGITADNQWFGDMMILQVLADSEQVNEQEREVLTRWLAASQPPDVHMRGATQPCALGVGCDEAGVCYAEAHGQPEQCPHSSAGVARAATAKATGEPS